jgi:hypothetical protein
MGDNNVVWGAVGCLHLVGGRRWFRWLVAVAVCSMQGVHAMVEPLSIISRMFEGKIHKNIQDLPYFWWEICSIEISREIQGYYELVCTRLVLIPMTDRRHCTHES